MEPKHAPQMKNKDAPKTGEKENEPQQRQRAPVKPTSLESLILVEERPICVEPKVALLSLQKLTKVWSPFSLQSSWTTPWGHPRASPILGKESIRRPAPVRNFSLPKNWGHRGKISVVDMVSLVFIGFLC